MEKTNQDKAGYKFMVSSKWLRWILPRSIRNAIRAPKRTIELWILSLISFIGGYSTHQVREDWHVNCHPISLAAFDVHTKVEEFKQELNGFVQHSQPDMILLDIGSHYGVFTLAALHYGGLGARVIAVEPSPIAQSIFQTNLKLAGTSNRVDFINGAVSEKTGTMPMLSTGAAGEYMLVSSTQRSDAKQINIYTINSIVEFTNKKPTHIKIDVEGHEEQVILGGKAYLQQEKPKIFLELHTKIIRNMGKSPENILAILTDIGYIFERYGLPIAPNNAIDFDVCRLVCIPLNN